MFLRSRSSLMPEIADMAKHHRVRPFATTPLSMPEGLEARLRDRLHIAKLRAAPRTLANRLALGLALVGPGLLVMLGDNDAGGVVTYAQTGATYGFSLFIPLLIPLGFIAYLVQEMTIRLGAVTRRGHAEMIWKRYGAFWGAFSLVDLVAANVLTLMTEFIGIRVASAVFGVPYLVTIPLAFAFITGILLFLKYHSWERISLIVASCNLIFVPLALCAHPDWGAIGRTFAGGGWSLPGGLLSASFLVLVSANIGTTIAPWQLFFQQSCVVDKGLLPQDIAASRRDLMLGVIGMVLVAAAIIALAAQYLHGLPNASSLKDDDVLAAIGSREPCRDDHLRAGAGRGRVDRGHRHHCQHRLGHRRGVRPAALDQSGAEAGAALLCAGDSRHSHRRCRADAA